MQIIGIRGAATVIKEHNKEKEVTAIALKREEKNHSRKSAVPEGGCTNGA